MYRPKDLHERLLHRLKIAEGHLKVVANMVENGTYCIDVINQSKAVQNALKEVDFLLLENHLNTCVVDLVRKDKTEDSVKEIMKVFRKQD